MRQDVEFMSEGTKVKGMFLTPDQGDGPFPTVVMAGGWCYVKELVQPSYAEVFRSFADGRVGVPKSNAECAACIELAIDRSDPRALRR